MLTQNTMREGLVGQGGHLCVGKKGPGQDIPFQVCLSDGHTYSNLAHRLVAHMMKLAPYERAISQYHQLLTKPSSRETFPGASYV